MQELYDSDFIYKRHSPSYITNFLVITLASIFVSIVVAVFIEYESYNFYDITFIKENDMTYFIAYVSSDEVNFLVKNNYYIFENKKYEYKVDFIEEEIVADGFKFYKKVYIHNASNIDEDILIPNNVLKIKILKNRKRIINYLFDFLKGG